MYNRGRQAVERSKYRDHESTRHVAANQTCACGDAWDWPERGAGRGCRKKHRQNGMQEENSKTAYTGWTWLINRKENHVWAFGQ